MYRVRHFSIMEESNLKINRTECPKCGAVWLNGQHYWKTGSLGDEKTLNNLVCATHGDDTCINPNKQSGVMYENHDTWESRSGFIKQWKPE